MSPFGDAILKFALVLSLAWALALQVQMVGEPGRTKRLKDRIVALEKEVAAKPACPAPTAEACMPLWFAPTPGSLYEARRRLCGIK